MRVRRPTGQGLHLLLLARVHAGDSWLGPWLLVHSQRIPMIPTAVDAGKRLRKCRTMTKVGSLWVTSLAMWVPPAVVDERRESKLLDGEGRGPHQASLWCCSICSKRHRPCCCYKQSS